MKGKGGRKFVQVETTGKVVDGGLTGAEAGAEGIQFPEKAQSKQLHEFVVQVVGGSCPTDQL